MTAEERRVVREALWAHRRTLDTRAFHAGAGMDDQTQHRAEADRAIVDLILQRMDAYEQPGVPSIVSLLDGGESTGS